MYIRTKDGRILDFDKLNEVSKLSIDMAEEPIREAKTIEELCDEFVYQTGGSISKGKPMISKNDFLSLKEWYVTGGINQNNIFGAIWTSKGLIYVAKMNSKGELELIWKRK